MEAMMTLRPPVPYPVALLAMTFLIAVGIAVWWAAAMPFQSLAQWMLSGVERPAASTLAEAIAAPMPEVSALEALAVVGIWPWLLASGVVLLASGVVLLASAVFCFVLPVLLYRAIAVHLRPNDRVDDQERLWVPRRWRIPGIG